LNENKAQTISLFFNHAIRSIAIARFCLYYLPNRHFTRNGYGKIQRQGGHPIN
jgi:hypothetical protein